MDRVSRDENRIAARIKIVASSNVNPKVQPLELQGKGNTSPKRRKKKKRSVFGLDCCRLSTISRGGKNFRAFIDFSDSISNFAKF